MIFQDCERAGGEFGVVGFAEGWIIAGEVGREAGDAVAGDDEDCFVVVMRGDLVGEALPVTDNSLRVDVPSGRRRIFFIPFF